MVDRIEMDKRVTLGYDRRDDQKLIGRVSGYDIYIETVDQWSIIVRAYDCRTKRVRRDSWLVESPSEMETQHRVVALVGLSKARNVWCINVLKVDSRFRGDNLAIKLYKFILTKLDITLKAGDSQSPGGRYVWNKLYKTAGVVIYARKSPYSKIVDFPKAGKHELVCGQFDLYDSIAEIFAVAG